MHNFFLRAAGTALLPLSLAACTAPAPYVDQHIGEGADKLRMAQILRPGAENNMTPPTGISSAAGKAGYDQYQKSFKAPAPQNNTFLIGVGR